jgi:hypothetical protein
MFALLALGTAGVADAQIGGLIKKKVSDAVKAPEKPADPAKAESKQGFVNGNSDVLEITPPVLEGFMRGLNVEVALRKEFAAELKKYPTREEYDRCSNQAASSEEAQKLIVGLADIPETATAEQRQKAIEKYAADQKALVKRKCPLNPSEAPNREKRLTEIKAKAAEAAGPDASGGEFALEPGESPGALGVSAVGGPMIGFNALAGLTPRQYDILLERIKRFCEELKNAADKGFPGSGGVSIPGAGGGKIFWVYTPTEAKTLSQQNCQRVYDAVGQLI